MKIRNVPKVIAIIPDGNRRWAGRHSFSVFNGYRTGVRKFIDFADWCKEYGVKNITVWGFSTENFDRSAHERKALFKLYKKVATDKEVIDRLCKNKTRFKVIGNTWLLPKDLLFALRAVEERTKHYKDRVINMLIAYGGADDILYGVREMAKLIARNGGRINESTLRAHLLSNSVPDLDLVIRTSGEERLSGFMPLQSSYAELYFSDKLWPDFTKKDLRKALLDYSKRKRRFGK